MVGQARAGAGEFKARAEDRVQAGGLAAWADQLSVQAAIVFARHAEQKSSISGEYPVIR